MKKLNGLLLFLFLALAGIGMPLNAAESGSPYDSVLDTSKNTNSAVDGFLDGAKDVDKAVGGKLAEFLKQSSIWKNLSGKAQSFITANIGKLGPLVKKLGWIANAIDLAPSVYNMVTSLVSRDREKFKTSFRDTALKTAGIIVGLGIGAAVSAAIPAVVAATAATGGAALVAIAAGGAVVSVAGGYLADKAAKALFSKTLENFADKLYNKLINNTAGPSIAPGSAPSGSRSRNGGGPVTLDKLSW